MLCFQLGPIDPGAYIPRRPGLARPQRVPPVESRSVLGYNRTFDVKHRFSDCSRSVPLFRVICCAGISQRDFEMRKTFCMQKGFIRILGGLGGTGFHPFANEPPRISGYRGRHAVQRPNLRYLSWNLSVHYLEFQKSDSHLFLLGLSQDLSVFCS